MNDALNIEAKAAEWLVRRDALSTELDCDFAEWLAADPRHRAAYLRLAAAWERTAHMKRLLPQGSLIDPDILLPHPKRGLRLWVSLAIATSVAAMALSATWWFLVDRSSQAYRTEVGGLSRVVLADGSTMTLNTDTEVRVRFSPGVRRVTLLRGEAQFAVVHNANRPFEVAAGGRLVRDVGTAFDIRLDSNEALQVIVTEGQIALENTNPTDSDGGASAATVSAGESAVAEAGKVTVRRVSTTEASRHLAWQVGELSFQGETLKEAVAEFNRYNRKKLKVRDPSIAGLQIGGNFLALDVDSFVAALQRSFDVTAKPAEDGTILLDRASAPTPD